MPVEAAAECIKCKGYGFILGDLEATLCSCGLVERTLINKIIPPEYRPCTFDNYHPYDPHRPGQEKAREFVRTWEASGRITTLLLWGNLGAGKSHLMAAKVRQLIALGHRHIEWHSAEVIYAEYVNSYSSQGESGQEIEQHYQNIATLILDDFCQEVRGEKPTDPCVAFWHRLFCLRHDFKRTTIITTNQTPDIIQKWYGRRIMSRWRKIANIMKVPGDDYRDKIARGLA